MDDLTPTPVPQLSLPQKKRRNVAFMVVIVFFAAIGILALFNNRTGTKNANTAVAGPFRTGTTVVVDFGSGKFDTTGTAIIAVDIESLNAFSNAGQNGNDIMDTLLSRGKIFTTPNPTKVRVLDSRPSVTQVRIIEGDAQGKDGWVSNVFLYE